MSHPGWRCCCIPKRQRSPPTTLPSPTRCSPYETGIKPVTAQSVQRPATPVLPQRGATSPSTRPTTSPAPRSSSTTVPARSWAGAPQASSSAPGWHDQAKVLRRPDEFTLEPARRQGVNIRAALTPSSRRGRDLSKSVYTCWRGIAADAVPQLPYLGVEVGSALHVEVARV
jgi:hypothetical protein